MAEILWYYARDDKQFGPVSASELKQLADAGRITPEDLLWREGMEAWTTAINLRGLFADESSPEAVRNGAGDADQTTLAAALPKRRGASQPAAPGVSLRRVLRATQTLLWIMCVLVVLAGIVLFTRAFLVAKAPEEEAAAGAVYSTFFIGAYVLARCGEKLCRLLLARMNRRSR
jgi:hypothetical protein